MEPPLVYVVIVNWNLRDVTLDCLKSLSQVAYPNCRVLVVDHHSQDGSPEAIARQFPAVEQIVCAENRGSTAGYNTGFRRALDAGADYVLLLNNDTYIDPAALDHLVAAAAEDGVGMVAPLILFADAPQVVWSAGARRSRLTLDLYDQQGQGQPAGRYQRIIERDFLTSCALLIKREVLETLGLMDEDFFLYHEEMDYTYRARAAGYRLLLVPQARVWHRVSLSSGGSGSPTARYWMAKNLIVYFRKNARGWQWLFIVPWRLASALKMTARLLAARQWAALLAYWRGLRDGLSFRLSRTSVWR
jgi:GT2 family glycosyltransferase